MFNGSRTNWSEFCLIAVERNGDMLEFVPDKLKTPELCLAAVKQNIRALQYVPSAYKTDIEKKLGL
jgi:hypothetical protein